MAGYDDEGFQESTGRRRDPDLRGGWSDDRDDLPPPIDRTKAAGMVKAPAICMLVVAIIGILCQIGLIVFYLAFPGVMRQFMASMEKQAPPKDRAKMEEAKEKIDEAEQQLKNPVNFIGPVLGILSSIFVIFASIQMMRLQTWPLALAGAIVVMPPYLSGCWCLGLPVGIWSIVVLVNQNVKASFR